MQTNGTTIWMADPADGTPKRLGCVLSAQPGNPTREADDSRKLEDKERKGDRAGTTITVGDTTVTFEIDPESDPYRCICEWFLNGRELLPGEVFSDGFDTQIAIAFCNGCTFYFGVWIRSPELANIEPDGKLTATINFSTNTCWCDSKQSPGATAPDTFDDWGTEIQAYYDSVTAGANAVGFFARKAAIAKANKTKPPTPAAAKATL